MRALLLCALLLPGLLAAQDRVMRARPTTAIGGFPPDSGKVGVTLNPNAPRIDDMPAPAPQIGNVSPTSITLTWNAIVGASGYIVSRSDVGVLTTPPLPLTTTSYTHRAGLDYRVTYRYQVVALYPNGHTGPSLPVSFTPPKPPVATEFDVNLIGSEMVLSWSLSGPWTPDRFVLMGPGMPDGVVLRGDQYQYAWDSGVFVEGGIHGPQSYTIAAMYEPGPVSAPAAEWPRVTAEFPWGRYRFTIVGFDAQQTTNDDSPWHRDGKGDEVFIAGAVHRYEQSTGTLLEAAAVRTLVYGEGAPRFPDRIAAGGIPGGGIQPGDQVFYSATPPGVPPGSALPLVIWEGNLIPGEVLVIRPAVFEADAGAGGASGAFAEWRRDVTTQVYRGDQPRLQQLTHELSVQSILTDLGRHERGGILTGIPMWEQGSVDQKIGPDLALVLDQGKIERFFQYGLTPEFTLRGGSGHVSAGGLYKVRMKIERMPVSPIRAVRR